MDVGCLSLVSRPRSSVELGTSRSGGSRAPARQAFRTTASRRRGRPRAAPLREANGSFVLATSAGPAFSPLSLRRRSTRSRSWISRTSLAGLWVPTSRRASAPDGSSPRLPFRPTRPWATFATSCATGHRAESVVRRRHGLRRTLEHQSISRTRRRRRHPRRRDRVPGCQPLPLERFRPC